MEGRTLTISYAEPKYSEEQAATPLKSRAVYVGNLPPGATEERVKELFTQYGEASLQHSELLLQHSRCMLLRPDLIVMGDPAGLFESLI